MSEPVDVTKAKKLTASLKHICDQIAEFMPPGLSPEARELEPFASLSQVRFYAEEAQFYLTHNQQTHVAAPSRQPDSSG